MTTLYTSKALEYMSAMTELLEDGGVWEATGPDAIHYPFPTCMMGKTDTQRDEIRDKMKEHLQGLEDSMIKAIVTKDDAELGRIFRTLAESFVYQDLVEMIGEDNV